MIKLQHISYLLFACVIFASCKKEIVEIPESNDPVFVIEGTIGEEKINYIAGDDNTVFSSSIATVNGVELYTGTMTQGETQIDLGMYKGENDLEQLNLGHIIEMTQLDFAALSTQPLFEVKHENFMNSSNIKEIKWYVDGEYAGTNNLKIFEPGKYQVCAQILYGNKYVSQICNDIIVGYNRSNESILKFTIGDNNNLNSWIESSGEVSAVKWYLNDMLVSEQQALTTVLPSNFVHLKAEITFANGSKRTRRVLVDGTHSNCSIEDFAQYEKFDNLSWDYKLSLNIKHQGKTYSSMDTDNSQSSLKINSISFFGTDTNGNPVYLIRGALKSKVKSKASNEILAVDLNLSWGLTFK